MNASVGRSMVRLASLVREASDLRRLPEVRIVMSGDARAKALYREFTRRHARWRLIANKGWGVALLRIPSTTADQNRLMRRKVKAAREAGFSFRPIVALDHVADVMAIHRSASERQGRPMHPDYFDEAVVRRYLSGTADIFGVFDRQNTLQAYLCMRRCGEVVCLERLLGNSEWLDKGTMYLLFSGVIDWLNEQEAAQPRSRWLMYDMFSGASSGMRLFKSSIGFRPYRVRWRWRDA